MPAAIFAIATLDTKGDELAFVAATIRAAGGRAVVVDVGLQSAATVAADVTREQVATHHPDGAEAVLSQRDRGQAVVEMSRALTRFLLARHGAGQLAGVIGIGGGGGTALITPALQALPIGLPKLMVSTVASGNVGPYIGCSDITLMYSVVDIAGLNAVARRILGNAAHAIVGMTANPVSHEHEKTAIGLTMFGVTTPCVTAARKLLEAEGYDCLVFHATGTGGRAMEKLVESDLIRGVLDVTTTEVADEVVGGVFPAGPARFDVILEKKIPYVLSLGALDMVNFGAKETVPADFLSRRLHVHNPQVTLMRTTPDENRRFARWIAAKINRSTAPVTILLPEKGVSSLDAPGEPFFDPEADAALFDTLEACVLATPERQVRRVPLHINDPEFARIVAGTFLDLMRRPR